MTGFLTNLTHFKLLTVTDRLWVGGESCGDGGVATGAGEDITGSP